MVERTGTKTLSEEDFEALNAFRPGDVVDLEITMPAASKRVKTEYLGMHTNNCMLFHIPTSSKWITVRDALTVDNVVVVRSIVEGSAGQVIAYRVKVLKLLSKPAGILITSFPSRIQRIGLRASTRSLPGIAVDIISEVFEGDENASGIIVDLSKHGCKIGLQVKPEWPILIDNTEITLVYMLDSKPVEINAMVKNHKLDNRVVYYGIKFQSGDAMIGELLARHTLVT
ncbi:PilZ domain-containing protein [Alteromonas sp. BMJM2]|uniref:PilZ domain-containing protein n=1 Tax=Alteromonas sp. BMJM2 TaxID=2954241 RepID=UPI0022B2E6CC|nr:PilZ domain-containing protein [Alteromonas sp. BMJM2]